MSLKYEPSSYPYPLVLIAPLSGGPYCEGNLNPNPGADQIDNLVLPIWFFSRLVAAGRAGS